ncbi:MAG TPA: hypothetical protein VMK65_13015 [Longimicrobiales bacterium]|nr:hypothetical protein [Longimicrobiales bacterium]
MKRGNPFGGDADRSPSRTNPFGEEPPTGSVSEAAARLELAALRVRDLRRQMGAEGLTLSGTRSLIEELGLALDAAARGLRALDAGREA